MADPTSTAVLGPPLPDRVPEPEPADLVQDLLVEEVSIDGMCGVY